jgi:polyhydroxyalkanoate synthesis regulator phasin
MPFSSINDIIDMKHILMGKGAADMSDIIDRIFNLGFGIASYSREKVEELVDELVARGEVAKKDAESMTKDLINKGKEESDKVVTMINDEIKKYLDKMDYVKRSEVEEMIEKRLNKEEDSKSDT